MVSNVFETEINGKKVGFKCGTLAVAIACREAKVKTVNQLIAKMAEEDLLACLALYYGCACQYTGKKEPELTMEMVGEWIEQMGEETAAKGTAILLERILPKNAQAPQEGANQ